MTPLTNDHTKAVAIMRKKLGDKLTHVDDVTLINNWLMYAWMENDVSIDGFIQYCERSEQKQPTGGPSDASHRTYHTKRAEGA